MAARVKRVRFVFNRQQWRLSESNYEEATRTCSQSIKDEAKWSSTLLNLQSFEELWRKAFLVVFSDHCYSTLNLRHRWWVSKENYYHNTWYFLSSFNWKKKFIILTSRVTFSLSHQLCAFEMRNLIHLNNSKLKCHENFLLSFLHSYLCHFNWLSILLFTARVCLLFRFIRVFSRKTEQLVEFSIATRTFSYHAIFSVRHSFLLRHLWCEGNSRSRSLKGGIFVDFCAACLRSVVMLHWTL